MKNITTLLILLSLGSRAFAAEKPLAWNDCLQEAAAHNQDLLSAEQSLKAADSSKIASLGQFLPQLSVSGSLNRSGPDDSFEGALSNPGYNQGARLSLSAQQNIFSGLKDVASVDSANASLDLARAQFLQAKAQLSRDLKVAFYTLLYSQKQVELLRSIADRNKANRDLVEMNYKGGTDNKGSLLQAEASYQQSAFEVEQAARALRVGQRQLAQLLGRDPSGSLEVEGAFDYPALSGKDPDFKNLVPSTPAHLQALARLHSSESQYVTSRASFLPTLSANASLFRAGGTFDRLDETGWSAGLAVSYPLFTGGRDFFNLKSAEESKKGAEMDLKGNDLKTAAQLESSYTAYQNAVDNTGVQGAFLKAAQSREEIGKAQYLNGLLSFQNWDQLETNLTSQQKTELSSRLGAKTAEANWELAQGKGEIP